MNGLILYVRLTMHLLRLDCRNFITSVFYSLIAKILLFLSMILPVKIILFLNPSQQIPNFVIELLGSKTNLIFALCGFMLVSMALASVFNKKSQALKDEKIDNLLALLTEKPDYKAIESTKTLVTKCALSSTLIIFSLICVIGALILYPTLVAISIISFICYIIFSNIYIKHQDPQKASKVIDNLLSKLGVFTFITSLLYIVLDATANNAGHDFLILVLSLLLVRQYSTMGGKTAINLITMNKNKDCAVKILESVS